MRREQAGICSSTTTWIAEKREMSGEHERQASQWQVWPKFGEEVSTAMNVKWLFKVTQPNQGSYHGIRTQLHIQEDTDTAFKLLYRFLHKPYLSVDS